MTLAQSLMATAELTGTRLSEVAAELLIQDLSRFPEEAVIGALARCRMELKGRLTVAEIIARIEDGRPGPDEAWGLLVWDEEATAVLTPEMEQAQGAAWEPWKAGDKVGARFAFREAYIRLVNEARQLNRPVTWTPSLGWDTVRRIGPIREAVQRNRLALAVANRYLPTGHLIGAKELTESAAIPADVRELIEEVKQGTTLRIAPRRKLPVIPADKRAEIEAELKFRQRNGAREEGEV